MADYASLIRPTSYVAIDVQGLQVVWGREHVYVPNVEPLNITGRLYGAGANQ